MDERMVLPARSSLFQSPSKPKIEHILHTCASLLIKKDLIDNWRSEAPQVDHIASLINRNKHCVCNDIVIADIIMASCARSVTTMLAAVL